MPSKSAFLSVTNWGVVIGVAAPIAMRYGFDISGLETSIVAVLGGLAAIWGRWRAKTQLTV